MKYHQTINASTIHLNWAIFHSRVLFDVFIAKGSDDEIFSVTKLACHVILCQVHDTRIFISRQQMYSQSIEFYNMKISIYRRQQKL